MATDRSLEEPSARRYRIPPWPIRVGVPLLTLVVVVGLIGDGAYAATPIVVILAAAWIYAGEHCGLVVTDQGIESRMTRRENRFRHRWADVDGFELMEGSTQLGIVMRLRDGSRVLMPSTHAWFWDKRKVVAILGALRREQAQAGPSLNAR